MGIGLRSGSGLVIFTFKPVGLQNYGLEPDGPLNFAIKPCDMGKSSFKKASVPWNKLGPGFRLM